MLLYNNISAWRGSRRRTGRCARPSRCRPVVVVVVVVVVVAVEAAVAAAIVKVMIPALIPATQLFRNQQFSRNHPTTLMIRKKHDSYYSALRMSGNHPADPTLEKADSCYSAFSMGVPGHWLSVCE